MNAQPPLQTGEGGLPKLCIRASDGASVEIYPHGAHVTSWRVATDVPGNAEQLFLSSNAVFDGKAALRGGVPIIFPQFADFGPLLKHGFARTAGWQFIPVNEGEQASALFRLESSASTRKYWLFAFRADYQVHVAGRQLELRLQITNADTRPFSFTAALHTYLRVADIAAVRIAGLQGLRYRDSANGGKENLEATDATRIEGEVDRIYYSALRPIMVSEAEHCVRVDMQGFKDAVIWNPGPTKGAALNDLEADGYRHMLCVEAAVVESPVQLAPDETWLGKQVLTLE